jgi:hypothetical protein
MTNNKSLPFIIIILVLITFNGFSSGSKDRDKQIEKNGKILQLDNASYSERLARAVNNHTDISFSAFNGTDTIVLLNTDEGDELVIEFSSNINRGSFNLIFINPNNEIIVLLNQSQKGLKKLIPGKGISRIRMIGKEAGGILSLKIKGYRDIEFQRLERD